jgi:hypothetical protein
MRMKSNSTFRRFLMNLAITAACVVMPVKAWAIQPVSLVGETLSGWTLSWGSFDNRTRSYYWSEDDYNAAHKYANWYCKYDVFGSTESGNQEYTPDVDETLGKTITAESNRFRIMNQSGGSIPYDFYFNEGRYNMNKTCSELRVMPDNFLTSFRLGSCAAPDKGNSFSSSEFQKYSTDFPLYQASAEMASREFYVSDSLALLELHYAIVARDPTGGHSNDGCKPGFGMHVWLLNDDGSKKNEIQCGYAAYSSNELQRCNAFTEYGNTANYDTYGNSGWKSAYYDLKSYVGKKIRIEFETHDCAYGTGDRAGGHYAYCYFTAMLRPTRFEIKYCSTDQSVTITAPDVFDTYTWYGNQNRNYDADNKLVLENAVDNGTTEQVADLGSSKENVFYRSHGSELTYKYYACKMQITGNQCPVVVDTLLRPTQINEKLVITPGCMNSMTLSDKTTYSVDGDTCATRIWYVFSAAYSKGKKPSDVMALSLADLSTLQTNGDCVELTNSNVDVPYTMDPAGQLVRLDLTNKSNCASSTAAWAIPNPVASWDVVPLTVCDGEPVSLTFKYNSSYSYPLTFDAYNESGTLVGTVGGDRSIKVVDAIDYNNNSVHNFNYVVHDKYGCLYNKVYPVKVKPAPQLALAHDVLAAGNYDEIKENKKYVFYVCPGDKRKVQVTTVTQSSFDTDKSGIVTNGTLTGGLYLYPESDNLFKFGSHYITATADGCTSTLYFDVAYHSDSVKLAYSDPVCPYDTVPVSVSNLGVNHTLTYWWNSLTTVSHKVSANNTYDIIHPDGALTYYCEAYDNYDCKYVKSWQFTVNKPQNSSFQFLSGTSHLLQNSEFKTSAAGHSSHYYELNKICSENPITVTASANNNVDKANFFWSTSLNPTWVASSTDYASASLSSQTKYNVKPGSVLYVYVKTQPYDNLGNALCSSFDTIAVSTYNSIRVTQKIGSAIADKAYVCDQSVVNLSVEPFFQGGDFNTDGSKFSVTWDDPNGGYADKHLLTEPVTAQYSNAENVDADGHYYRYTYTITSNVDPAEQCTSSGTFSVYVEPQPNFVLEALPPYACASGVDTLKATDLTSSADPARVYDDARINSWVWPTVGSVSAHTSIAANNKLVFTNSATTDQTYTVTATSKLGCTASKSVVVAAAAQPKPSVFLIPAEGGAAIAFSENAAGELVSKSAICANTQYYLYVSDAELNYSALCSDTVWAHLQKNNAPYENVNWRSVTGGTVKSVSNANLTTNYNLIYGSSSVNNVAKMGYYTARTNDGSSATPVYDGYLLTINTPCGCVVTKTVKVEVAASPSIVVDPHSNFVCDAAATDNTSLKLNATGTSYAGGTITYKWFSGSHKGGDVDAQSLLSSTSSVEVKHQEEAVSTYTVEVLDSKSLCYATQVVQIANQEVPVFTVTPDPADFCKQAGTKVSLTASSSDPVSVGYYLRNLDGTYPNVSNPWDGSAKSVDPNKYMDASNNIYVKAREARRYGETITDPDIMGQFCYAEVPTKLSASIPPVINYGLYDATATNVNKTGAVCAGSQYTIKLQNTAAVSGKDVFEVYNLDSDTPDTPIWSNTVNFKMVATSSVFTAATDKTQERLRIKSYVQGKEECATETTVVVKINELPILQLGVDGLSLSTDTARYCANESGVTLKTNITNDNGGVYTYSWKKAGTAISGATAATLLASVDASGKNTAKNVAYSAQVVDNLGCVSNLANVIVAVVDTPAVWREVGRGCKGGSAAYSVNEYTYNQERYNIDFTPACEYKAYVCDKNGVPQREVTPMTSWSDVGWDYCGKNKAGVDTCGRIRMRAFFYIPMDATAKSDYYQVIQTSKATGCSSRSTIQQNPLDYADPDKIFVSINITDADGNVQSNVPLKNVTTKTVSSTPNMATLSDLSAAAAKGDTVVYACSDSKITFTVLDQTKYATGEYGSKNITYKPGDNSQFDIWGSTARTIYAVRNVSWNVGSNWFDPNSSSSDGRDKIYVVNPNWTMTGHFQLFAAPIDNNGCSVVGDILVGQGSSPTTQWFRDNACAYNADGSKNGLLKFSASSVGDGSTETHHYKWWSDDMKTRLADSDYKKDANTYEGDTFKIVPDDVFQPLNLANAGKTYYYRVSDKVDGYCASPVVRVSAAIYNNPSFTIAATPDRACIGDTVAIKVTQNYGICNGQWHYYYYGKSITSNETGHIYNSNATQNSYLAPNWVNLTYPHSFTDKRAVTAQNDSVYMTAAYYVNATMTYRNITTTNLNCITTKYVQVKAFETPNPVLRLIKNTAEGAYAQNDIVEMVNTTNSDSTGSRKLCPGADYRRVLWNANPDTMVMGGTNYATSKTMYTLKDLTTGVVVNLNGKSKGSTDENKVLTADNHDYMLSAVTSNGCKSDSVTFVLPLSVVPSVTINDGAGAVCQGDPATTTLSLVATPTNGSSFTYQWYKGNVMDDASKVGTDDQNYEAHPISAFSKNSKTTAIYSVKVWNENKCLAMDSDTINIWPLPQFTLSLAPATACANKTVVLTANKGAGETNYVNDAFIYSWGSGNEFGHGVGAVSAPSVNAASASRLYVKGEVTVADHITCSDTTSIPVPTYGVPEPSVKLYAAAPTGKYKTGDEIPAGALLCPGATWYPVFQNKKSDINCDLDTFFVKNQLSGKVDTFTSASGTLANQNGGTKVYTLTANTNFLYSIKTSCGCESATSSFSLGLANAPKITVSGNTSFCEGTKEKMTLTASAGSTEMNYTWGDPVSANTATVTFLPTDTRTIRVTGTSNDYGCPAMQDVTITQLARPHLTLSAKNNPVCLGSNAEITASTAISDGSTEFTYNWDPAASGSTISVPVNSASVTYTAIVTAKDMCKDTQSITVTSVPLPDPIATIYKVGNATAANMICPGSSYYPLFTNANSSNAAYTCALDTFHFIHTDANGKLIDEVVSEAAGTPANQAGATLKYDMNGTVKYTYYAVSSCGCKSGSKTVTVQEANNPTFTLSTSTGSTSFCEGASTNNITAAVASIGLVASDPNKIIDTWIWDAPATAVLDANGKATNTATITPADITYTVHGVSKAEYGGCPASASIKLTKMLKPSLSLTCEQPDVCVGSNAEIVANASVSDGTEVKAYNWTPTDVITSVSAAVSPYVSKDMTVTCQAVAANGCLSDLKSVKIQAVPIPVPTLAVIDEATGNDVTGKVLCPGTKYHLLYTAKSTVSGDYIC